MPWREKGDRPIAESGFPLSTRSSTSRKILVVGVLLSVFAVAGAFGVAWLRVVGLRVVGLGVVGLGVVGQKRPEDESPRKKNDPAEPAKAVVETRAEPRLPPFDPRMLEGLKSEDSRQVGRTAVKRFVSYRKSRGSSCARGDRAGREARRRRREAQRSDRRRGSPDATSSDRGSRKDRPASAIRDPEAAERGGRACAPRASEGRALAHRSGVSVPSMEVRYSGQFVCAVRQSTPSVSP